MSEKIQKNQECVQDHHFDTPYRFPASPTPQTRFSRKSSLVSFLRWKLEHFSRQDHLGYNLVNLPIWALKAIRSTYPTLIMRFLSLFGVDSVWKNTRLLPKQFQLITQEYWWRILSSSRCKTCYPRSQYRYGHCLDSVSAIERTSALPQWRRLDSCADGKRSSSFSIRLLCAETDQSYFLFLEEVDPVLERQTRTVDAHRSIQYGPFLLHWNRQSYCRGSNLQFYYSGRRTVRSSTIRLLSTETDQSYCRGSNLQF